MAEHREREEDDGDEESDAESHRSAGSGDSGRATMQMCPLDLRFSQKKMRNVFADGNLIDESGVTAVRAVRRSKEDAELYDAPWKLEADFPAIEVIKWRCKLRDDITGRPIIDPQSGKEMFDDEDRWFTLDNRRLYCLQRAAIKLLPERCTADVIAEVQRDRRLREIRKFRTLDSGKSILIGSRVDGVPFSRWNWRTEYDKEKQAGSKAEEAGGKGGKGGKTNGKSADRNAEHTNWKTHGGEDGNGAKGQKGGKRGGKGHDKGSHYNNHYSGYDNGYGYGHSYDYGYGYGYDYDGYGNSYWHESDGGHGNGKGRNSGKGGGGKAGGKWSDANGYKGGHYGGYDGGKAGKGARNQNDGGAGKELLSLLHGKAAHGNSADSKGAGKGKKGRGKKGSEHYSAGGVS
eukprot:TRINITY_DN121181_c0_g1_i1.p1 TRINITY_DN121181_c0_g1~~TRINITY_DN121181_c0_g1_i1.p1  ORF type:complete len:403 (+),score=95.49 TRINITY_DN121181_c0_g1_i1:141-1349(+)